MSKYTGRLAEKIKLERGPSSIIEYFEQLDRKDEAATAGMERKFLEKIPYLFEHFGLEQTGDDMADFFRLALALAMMHVPGFQFEAAAENRGKGREREWDAFRLTELIADVEVVKRRSRKTDSAACRFLSTSRRYESRWAEYSQKTLQNRLGEARNRQTNWIWALVEGVKSKRDKRRIIRKIIRRFALSQEIKG